MDSKEKSQKVIELMSKGIPLTEATNQVGIKKSTFSYWKTKLTNNQRKPPTKRKRASYRAIPIDSGNDRGAGLEFKGSGKDMAVFIKELTNQFGGLNG